MAKGPRRVKEFTFSERDGYSASAGKVPVKGYFRGGSTHADAPQDRKLVKTILREEIKADAMKPTGRALGGGVNVQSVGAGTGYVSPMRSMAAKKAARTRAASGGLKHLVD